jgi:zona occludens toxin
MAIYLITGSPGAGKTLFAVQKIMDELLKTGRDVYTDIEDFDHEQAGTIPFASEDGSPNGRHWELVPDNSIVVLDEVQRSFPQRNPASTVPPYISAMETHRHRGIDIWLITQSPKLIDRHIWPLVERHFHMHRVWGLGRSTCLQWESVAENPSPNQTHDDAQKKNFSFNKKYFGLYKSATVHTAQPKPPWFRIAVVVGGIAAAIGGFFLIKGNLGAQASPVAVEDVSPSQQFAVSGECWRAVGMIGERIVFERPDKARVVRHWVAPGDEVEGGLTRCS